MKEMTSVATTMMTDEEKAELEREMNGGTSTPSPSAVNDAASPTAGPSEATTTPPPSQPPSAESSSANGTAVTPSPLPSPGEAQGDDKHLSARLAKDKKDKRSKLTSEQKQKLQDLEVERRKNMEERIETLSKKLIDRLRPFVEAKNPGAHDDPETKAFEERMKREADDLKLESFGVEVCSLFDPVIYMPVDLTMFKLLHTIGNVYIMKASTFMKSKKLFGM